VFLEEMLVGQSLLVLCKDFEFFRPLTMTFERVLFHLERVFLARMVNVLMLVCSSFVFQWLYLLPYCCSPSRVLGSSHAALSSPCSALTHERRDATIILAQKSYITADRPFNPKSKLLFFQKMNVKSLKSLIGLNTAETWIALQQINRLTGKELFREKFRARIVQDYLYSKPGASFDKATALRPDQRQVLDAYTRLPDIVKKQTSNDGTVKYLLSTSQGNVETVYIPSELRSSLCVSSQVGCSLNCKFCHTGTQKLRGNLSSGDIVSQVLLAQSQLQTEITNILFMGQGEPLLNYKNVAQSISILTENLKIPARRITVSTSGIATHIPSLSKLGVKLAVSLHAATDELRSSLMPAASKLFPLMTVMDSVKQYTKLASANTRTLTFEWIMIKGITDTPEQANKLIALVAPIPSSINIIPFNPFPGSGFYPSDQERQDEFVAKLRRGLSGHPVNVRTPRGSNILAACGQLNTSD
jgi:23S rRNA (adenine2503-C2)-methyltransferase